MHNYPKKSLGQNFLRDPKILKKIVDFARIEPSDTVLEIGPGEGTLTAQLLERAKKIIAIEKDNVLAAHLSEKFKNQNGKLEIINGDVLNIENLLEIQKLKIKNYVLVGNIPYYITGAIFEKFLSAENPPKSMTFVVQKEVAERIMGGPHSTKASRGKKESILSISVKLYGTPEYGGIIKAGSFFPAPKVDSAIISIRDIKKPDIDEKKLFEILKKGFAHKRKLLASNLGIEPEMLERVGIPAKARAENLSVEDWIRLSQLLATNY